MKYMFLLYGDELIGETPTKISKERSAQWAEFHQLAELSGKLVGWHALVPSDEAKTVRPTVDSFIETDGPYAETKEQLGGVYILECTDIKEALSFADKMPCAAHGVVEVRQMLPDWTTTVSNPANPGAAIFGPPLKPAKKCGSTKPVVIRTSESIHAEFISVVCGSKSAGECAGSITVAPSGTATFRPSVP